MEGHGDRMGRIWGWNTAGAVLGSVGGGWLLLPAIGTDRGLALCSGLALLLAGGVARVGGGRREGVAAMLAAVGLAVVVAIVPLGPGQLWRQRFGAEAVLASWEGWEATTVVIRHGSDEPQIYSNGRGMTAVSKYLQGGRLLGDTMKGAKDVLVVGFGTGGLVKGLLETLAPDHLTVVEIDGAQFQAARWFDTDSALTDPRVDRVVDDALHYLATTEHKFDLILIDGWGPTASPALYTADFHRLAAARLTENGLTWAKLGHITDASRKPLQDAFRCVYPNAWFDPDDGYLMGALRPLQAGTPAAPPAGDDCDPLTSLRPRHIRAVTEVNPVAVNPAKSRLTPSAGSAGAASAPAVPAAAPAESPAGNPATSPTGDPPTSPAGSPSATDGPDPNKLTPEQLRARGG
jgi:spermidine synthase